MLAASSFSFQLFSDAGCTVSLAAPYNSPYVSSVGSLTTSSTPVYGPCTQTLILNAAPVYVQSYCQVVAGAPSWSVLSSTSSSCPSSSLSTVVSGPLSSQQHSGNCAPISLGGLSAYLLGTCLPQSSTTSTGTNNVPSSPSFVPTSVPSSPPSSSSSSWFFQIFTDSACLSPLPAPYNTLYPVSTGSQSNGVSSLSQCAQSQLVFASSQLYTQSACQFSAASSSYSWNINFSTASSCSSPSTASGPGSYNGVNANCAKLSLLGYTAYVMGYCGIPTPSTPVPSYVPSPSYSFYFQLYTDSLCSASFPAPYNGSYTPSTGSLIDGVPQLSSCLPSTLVIASTPLYMESFCQLIPSSSSSFSYSWNISLSSYPTCSVFSSSSSSSSITGSGTPSNCARVNIFGATAYMKVYCGPSTTPTLHPFTVPPITVPAFSSSFSLGVYSDSQCSSVLAPYTSTYSLSPGGTSSNTPVYSACAASVLALSGVQLYYQSYCQSINGAAPVWALLLSTSPSCSSIASNATGPLPSRAASGNCAPVSLLGLSAYLLVNCQVGQVLSPTSTPASSNTPTPTSNPTSTSSSSTSTPTSNPTSTSSSSTPTSNPTSTSSSTSTPTSNPTSTSASSPFPPSSLSTAPATSSPFPPSSISTAPVTTATVTTTTTSTTTSTTSTTAPTSISTTTPKSNRTDISAASDLRSDAIMIIGLLTLLIVANLRL